MSDRIYSPVSCQLTILYDGAAPNNLRFLIKYNNIHMNTDKFIREIMIVKGGNLYREGK